MNWQNWPDYRCLACDQSIARGNKDLCEECEYLLPWNLNACPLCGEPNREKALSEPQTTLIAGSARSAAAITTSQYAVYCIACTVNPPDYTATIAPLLHRREARRWVKALKYHRSYVAGNLLAAILADAVQAAASSRPDILVPVPSTLPRLLRRGHNPSAQIARELGRRLSLPIHFGIRRRGMGGSQVGLTKVRREHNLRQAFVTSDSFSGRHVAIIDDVITTGATVRAFAGCLRTAGAEQIEVWAATRTPGV